MERFFSILIEHYAGNFPFWIAPIQVNVLPIGENQHPRANEIMEILDKAGYRAIIDLRSEKVNRKIAESEQKKIPFSIIVGQKEVESGNVAVRQHGKGDLGSLSLEELFKIFEGLNVPGAA